LALELRLLPELRLQLLLPAWLGDEAHLSAPLQQNLHTTALY